MRAIITTFFLIIAASGFAQMQKELIGVYQGSNIYVMNPFASTGVGFCVYEVTVNGQVAADEINSSSFEIDLAPYSLSNGDEVKIVIKHKSGCEPKILNPEVLQPQSTFEIVEISMNKDGQLSWTTINENGSLPFVILQYRWNKWITIDKVEGKGTPGKSIYTYDVFKPDMKPHFGLNRYKLRQTDFKRRPRFSEEVSYRPLKVKDVEFSPQKASSIITFTNETSYEIFDEYGKRIMRGYGLTIDISKLAKGTYYLNYDNKISEFTKK
ncbi:MAG TPA: hypothetical protein DCQ31_03430 [Bacteroidales bacterium]|nr:hypothetical protein [Bacteroidales bacterium]